MSEEQSYYYGVQHTSNGIKGKVYTYDKTGQHEVNVYTTDICEGEEEALEEAVKWCEEHNVEAELE